LSPNFRPEKPNGHAEGVGTADQLLFLRAAGVHSMQGDRFGKAVSVAEITARLQSPSAFQPTETAALTS
jgi:EAL domain-containing protein (putative c-di-GMP-specific phosphodiesterase class I)